MVQHAYNLFTTAISSVHPSKLIKEYIVIKKSELIIDNHKRKIKSSTKVVILAIGKAAAAMALQAEEVLGDAINDGICVTKYHHSLPLRIIKTVEAGHPVPDKNSEAAANMILQMVTDLGSDDVIIVLLSGGASSLIADIPAGLTLSNIQEINELLIKSDAPIHEINTVRKHSGTLKGGQLVKAAYPATVYSLVISDVPGDDLQTIGSGLTAPDTSTFEDALNIINKYDKENKVSLNVIDRLRQGIKNQISETPKPGDPVFDKTFNKIIGNISTALIAAKVAAEQSGFHVIECNASLSGNTISKAKEFAKLLLAFNGPQPACFLWGGETTLNVTGEGMGGRNQHFALGVLNEMKEHWNRNESFSVLCGGTDGTDGPTDAAGAIIDSHMLTDAQLTKDLIEKHLADFNSYDFFKEQGRLLFTGPTQTNVMDIVIGLVDKID